MTTHRHDDNDTTKVAAVVATNDAYTHKMAATHTHTSWRRHCTHTQDGSGGDDRNNEDGAGGDDNDDNTHRWRWWGMMTYRYHHGGIGDAMLPIHKVAAITTTQIHQHVQDESGWDNNDYVETHTQGESGDAVVVIITAT